MTTASMLLKSCAMPPVSWPTASIFCDCLRWNNNKFSPELRERADLVAPIALINAILDRLTYSRFSRNFVDSRCPRPS